jgi:hypothetical protein
MIVKVLISQCHEMLQNNLLLQGFELQTYGNNTAMFTTAQLLVLSIYWKHFPYGWAR